MNNGGILENEIERRRNRDAAVLDHAVTKRNPL